MGAASSHLKASYDICFVNGTSQVGHNSSQLTLRGESLSYTHARVRNFVVSFKLSKKTSPQFDSSDPLLQLGRSQEPQQKLALEVIGSQRQLICCLFITTDTSEF